MFRRTASNTKSALQSENARKWLRRRRRRSIVSIEEQNNANAGRGDNPQASEASDDEVEETGQGEPSTQVGRHEDDKSKGKDVKPEETAHTKPSGSGDIEPAGSGDAMPGGSGVNNNIGIRPDSTSEGSTEVGGRESPDVTPTMGKKIRDKIKSTIPNIYKPEDEGKDIWHKFHNLVEKHDNDMCKVWNDEIQNLLFTGLFTAAVTAFVVEAYQWLQESKEEQNMQALSQIVLILAKSTIYD
ncbi:hypothetical protein AX16_000648 [Volvariella volvacea WC 439]|nr:hypothetical protein AX16_000648 [Volvariella volvacea WC 439]